MRIGEFAVKNNTTIDTVRHYMDLSLLTPEKEGSFYEFEENCHSGLLEEYRLLTI